MQLDIMPLRRGYLEAALPSVSLMLLLLLTTYTGFAFWCWEESQQLMSWILPNKQISFSFPAAFFFPVKDEKEKKAENVFRSDQEASVLSGWEWQQFRDILNPLLLTRT